MNDLFEMLLNLKPMLAAGWAVWFAFGLALSIWGRWEKTHVFGTTKHKSGVRAEAASKPPSGVRAPVTPVQSVPVASGDAFGELERLLEPETRTHRTPGERTSPVLAAEVTGSNGATLTAPQSLP